MASNKSNEKPEKQGILRRMGIGKDDAGMEVKDPNPEMAQDSPWQTTTRQETRNAPIHDTFEKSADLDATETVGAAGAVAESVESDPKPAANTDKPQGKGFFSWMFGGGAKAMESPPTTETFDDSNAIPTNSSVDSIAGPRQGQDAQKKVEEAVDVKAPSIGTRVKEEVLAVGDKVKGMVGKR